MRGKMLFVLGPAVLLTAACGRNSPKIDDALKSDLALASQVQPYNPNISPTEAGFAPQQYAPQQYAPRTTQAVARQPVSTARRSTARRSSSSSSGGYYPAPAPRTTVEKHTGRDAAIGAAAGAVLGATASRDKIKGGLIGAAAGAILGGVIGNNVDITRRTTPY